MGKGGELTYGDGEVHDVIDLDDVLFLPDVVKHVVHDAKGLVPYELVVSLRRIPVSASPTLD